jgi:hypothetical protein
MDSACTTRTPEPTERSIDQQTTIEGRLNEREGKKGKRAKLSAFL